VHNKYFNVQGISHCNISSSLHFDRIYYLFKLDKYDHIKHGSYPVLFFGVYRMEDVNNIKNHRGKKYILWGGSDANIIMGKKSQKLKKLSIINKIKRIDIAEHFSSSDCLSTRLDNLGIKNTKFVNWLADPQIFRPLTNVGECIYVYCGRSIENPYYSGDLVQKVIKKLPQFKFILSCDTYESVSHEKMSDIYKQCFIGLRLTPYDGGAATVQELGLMGIPCIHNNNYYPNVIKYETIDDIIIAINDVYVKNFAYHENICGETIKYLDNVKYISY